MKARLLNQIIWRSLSVWFYIHDGTLLRASRFRRKTSSRSLTSLPLVSVIIPTHNRCDILVTRCLRSVLDQSYVNLQILVCAHGCTDGTAVAVASLGDPRVEIIQVPRTSLGYPGIAENHWLVGPVRPLNAGTQAAKGEWIAVIGDDDEWTPDHIAHSLVYLSESRNEFVSSYSLKIDGVTAPTVIGKDSYGRVHVGGVSTWVYSAQLRYAKWNVNSWRKPWNRPNDIDFLLRLKRTGVRMGFSDHVGHVWSLRPDEGHLGSLAYQVDPNRYESLYELKPGSDASGTD